MLEFLDLRPDFILNALHPNDWSEIARRSPVFFLGPIQQRVKKKKENDRGFSGFSGSDRFDRCDRGVICDMT